MFEVVKIEGLPDNKAAAMEGVADLELGVHGFRHLEVPLTQMQEAASAGVVTFRPMDCSIIWRNTAISLS